jgi:hypothetical protein
MFPVHQFKQYSNTLHSVSFNRINCTVTFERIRFVIIKCRNCCTLFHGNFIYMNISLARMEVITCLHTLIYATVNLCSSLCNVAYYYAKSAITVNRFSIPTCNKTGKVSNAESGH